MAPWRSADGISPSFEVPPGRLESRPSLELNLRARRGRARATWSRDALWSAGLTLGRPTQERGCRLPRRNCSGSRRASPVQWVGARPAISAGASRPSSSGPGEQGLFVVYEFNADLFGVVPDQATRADRLVGVEQYVEAGGNAECAGHRQTSSGRRQVADDAVDCRMMAVEKDARRLQRACARMSSSFHSGTPPWTSLWNDRKFRLPPRYPN